MDSVLQTISTCRVIPMIKTIPASQSGGLGEALMQGGLPIANVSVQSREGLRMIELLAVQYPELLVGAGNVQKPAEAARAMDAGARFIFSPLFDVGIIDLCKNRGIAVFPVTTDPELARQEGLEVLAMYPVELLGGIKTIDSMAEGRSLRFIVAGGIVKDNLSKYLTNTHVIAAIGSWMIDPVLAVTGQWDAFAVNCGKARLLASSLVSPV